MSIPVSALTGGAGGNELDSPGTTPPPHSSTAPLDGAAGGGGGIAADGDHPSAGTAPIPFPGEEDVADEVVGGASEMEGDQEAEALEADMVVGSSSAGRGGGGGGGRGGAMRGRGRPKGLKGGNNVEQAKVARAITAGKKAANLPGTSQLPTARVKKIIMSDPDVDGCGKEATFAIGKACELYVHHLVEEAYTQARLSQRKAIYYKDISKAIKANPHLEFLEDVVPHAMPLSLALAERQRVADYESALETGPANPSGYPSGNGNGGAPYAEDSDVGLGTEAEGERLRTHSHLTAAGKKVNKKSRPIGANKRSALEASDGVADGMGDTSDVEGEAAGTLTSHGGGREGSRATQNGSDGEVDSASEKEEGEPSTMLVDR